jgi:beta-lactamase regulating signal transducer with metallopeptidase domain
MSVFFAAAAKAGLLLLFAGAAARSARRFPAALRHAILVAGAAGALAVPLLQAILPGWGGRAEIVAGASDGGTGSAVLAGVLTAWALGSLGMLVGTLRARIAAGRVVRDAAPARDARILSLAISLREELGFGGPLRIRISRRMPVPVCAGILRPRIVLPRSAAGWPRSRLRAVLLHEIGHLRRRDVLTGLVGELCRAAYWFLPFAWWNLRSMRFLREAACDDRVLRAGARPSGYAALLLRMSRTARRPDGGLRAAAALGGRSELARRLEALLAPGRRRTGAGRAGVAVAVAMGLFAGALSGAGAAPQPHDVRAGRTHAHHVHVFVSASAGTALAAGGK